MTQSKHTPGPWTRADRQVVVAEAPWMGIATVSGSETDEQNFVNGNLIAAAPELLEACERAENELLELLELDENSTSVPSVMFVLRAAIAKAKGER